MDREEQMLLRHFQDLSRAAWQRNRYSFTDFLNLNELSLLQDHARELSGEIDLFGGRETCERQVAAFLPERIYQEEKIPYPISCIHIIQPGARFAASSLTHRDYLGAILGLGVDRSKIGDIIVEDQEAYFFCISNIASFLLEELTQIGRQTVRCEEVDPTAVLGEVKQEEVSGTVSSCRLDAIIGVAFRTSRSQTQQLIEAGKVYVNARQILSSHYLPAEGDVISVRGYGKFQYEGSYGQSKKGRMQIRISKYI